jgi:type IV pilus assembly protein PilY1
VLNANTGALIRTIDFLSDGGTQSDPAGLAELNGYMPDVYTDNTVLRMYGGDLLGNVWGFDINVDDGNANKVAKLPTTQPVTIAPLVATVYDAPTNTINVVLFFGTGKYLDQSDLTLPTISQQAIYGIKDACWMVSGTHPVFDDSRAHCATADTSSLIQQTMSGHDASTLTSSTITWSSTTQFGWYINLNTGELVNIMPEKFSDNVVFATLQISGNANAACGGSGGGEGYLYSVKASAGNAGDILDQTHFTHIITGLTLFGTTDGQPRLLVSGAGSPTTTVNFPDQPNPPPDNGNDAGPPSSGTRIIWHELRENQ